MSDDWPFTSLRATHVRPELLFEAAAFFQRITWGGAFDQGGRSGGEQAHCADWPVSSNPAESSLLRGLTTEFVLRRVLGDPGYWLQPARIHAIQAALVRRQDPAAGLGALVRLVLYEPLGRRLDAADEALAIRARSLLDGAVGFRITLKNLSQRLAASMFCVARVFRRTFGETAAAYAARRRMQEARRRLSDTDDKVAVIALELGYRSPKNFYEAFKRATGHTPDAFRRQHDALTSPTCHRVLAADLPSAD